MQGNDKIVSMILAKIKPPKKDMGDEYGEDESGHEDQLHGIAEELVEAVRSGNTRGVVDALRGAFLCLDAEPHIEGKHVDIDEEDEEEEEGKGGKVDFKEYFRGGPVRYAEGGRVGPASKVQPRRPASSNVSPDKLKPVVEPEKPYKYGLSEDQYDAMKGMADDYVWTDVLEDFEPATTEELNKLQEYARKNNLSIGQELDERLFMDSHRSPSTYAMVKGDPFAYKLFQQKANEANEDGTDDGFASVGRELLNRDSDFWRQVKANRRTASASDKKLVQAKDTKGVTHLVDDVSKLPKDLRGKFAGEISKSADKGRGASR